MADSKTRFLFVDLDETLIRTDLLFESMALLLKINFFLLFLIPFWRLRGKAILKYKLAQFTHERLEVESLPINQSVVDRIIEFKQTGGNKVYLITAATKLLAEKVAARWDFWDGIYSSDEKINLIGERKISKIKEVTNNQSYEYIGDSKWDIPIWLNAGSANIARNESYRFPALSDIPIKYFPPPQPNKNPLIRQIRLHQWSKNGLVFLPAILSHLLLNFEVMFSVLLTFLALSFTASATYILNDLLDLADDRAHESKKMRPMASGDLTIPKAIYMGVLLVVGAFVISFFLPVTTRLALVAYVILTLLYSFYIKRMLVLDMISLGMAFTLRIIAGALTVGGELTFWLLSWSFFFFFGLSAMKRFVDLKKYKEHEFGRAYSSEDRYFVSVIGIASGFCSFLLFSLYINSEEILKFYTQPEVLWLTLLVKIYWLTRLWCLAYRGQIDSDPVEFALKDKPSWVAISLIGIAVIISVYA